MSLSDDQLEMLEAYLDGELPATDEESLRQRIDAEPTLVAALEQLRGERAVRAAFWRSCEPTDTAVSRVIAHVEAAVDRHNVWAYRLSHYRLPLAFAASVLLAFTIGWIGRGAGPQAITPVMNNAGGNTPMAVVPQPANPGMTNVEADRPVSLNIYDQTGRLVGVQRFRNADEAAKFIEDVTRLQKAQEQIRQQGTVTPNGSEKF